MDFLPNGAWPVMLTPFRDDHAIDWDAVEAYTDWLIRTGAAGIFAVALSSEMYDLTPAERVALTRRVSDVADGRVPVISSALGGEPAQIAAAAAAQVEAGAAAVVLIASTLATAEESDDVLFTRVQTVLEDVPDVPFGIYECPVPYKRLLTLETVRALASTGRFVFYKDTSHRMDTMTARIGASRGTPLKHYNAEISSLVSTQRAGGHGFCGYAANIYPDLVAWLCANYESEAVAEVERVQRLLSIAEHGINSRYPSSAKYLLAHRSGLQVLPVSRWKPEPIGPHEGQPLIDLVDYIDSLDLPGLRTCQ
ncbi:dihydrodipicolinate synthase family protein [Ruania alkalisoli]|uniref:Dihydrodipicolinate synthase family protein n=1 Tax=Ruania alkalisoli TaxID=2779775 RepID=A0A7M1SXS4_9MICO|nr:dihydrodipicolinate synthase family protein [Ruania alkalisoli]QOR71837.1 dihydrodipicolinate synthase family protein [Ruania alkalisoli]